jgi:hypothetical protein
MLRRYIQAVASQLIDGVGGSPRTPGPKGPQAFVASNWKISPIFSVSRKRRTKKLFDELSSDERLQDPETVFWVQVFYPAIDTAIFQLQSRFEEQHLVSKMFNFLFLKYLLQLSDEDLGEAAHKVHDAYSSDINSDIVSEVRSFMRQFKEEIEGSNYLY